VVTASFGVSKGSAAIAAPRRVLAGHPCRSSAYRLAEFPASDSGE
jgi:hypothetical protein